MYLGRIVTAGLTRDGKAFAAYRVSSRSFPNRTANLKDQQISIIPRPGCEGDLAKNPYIAYNCVRLCGGIALATNGSQTDPIIEKIISGMSVRDAFALSLLAMDYEKDHLDTPRIAAAVDANAGITTLGIIRKDALLVRQFTAKPGELRFVSTYELNRPSDENFDDAFDALTAQDACDYVIRRGRFAEFENPVTAAAAVWNGNGYDLAAQDA